MASLSQEHQKEVAAWAHEGATLNDIQSRLKSVYGISLTYLDLRLLLIEMGIKLQDKPREVPPQEAIKPVADVANEAEGRVDDWNAAGGGGGGKVSVTTDAISLPGAIASGKAVFSDGKTAVWFVDQSGRLGIRAAEPGYQPPPSDIPEFERQLDSLLSSL